MDPSDINSSGERRKIEQHRLSRLKDDAWLFVRAHWRTVLAGIVGFVIGYWKLRSDIGDAITAAHTAQAAALQLAGQVAELRRDFEQLASKQALDLTNKRIDDWNVWYASAREVAGEKPQPAAPPPRNAPGTIHR